jgi:hypothetical protein
VKLIDDLLMRSMLKRVGDLPEFVFLPMLRVMADDRDAVEAGWAAVAAQRRGGGLFESPGRSWERRYGQFVRELEWVSTELGRALPAAAVEELVSDAVAQRLRNWLKVILPAFGAVRIVPASLYPKVMDTGVQFATFLVGPIRRVHTEPDGTLVYDIPECAMHTVAGTGAAQTNSCLMGCKAACEKVFESSAMPLEFDPHLPGLSCTLRVRKSVSTDRSLL